MGGSRRSSERAKLLTFPLCLLFLPRALPGKLALTLTLTPPPSKNMGRLVSFALETYSKYCCMHCTERCCGTRQAERGVLTLFTCHTAPPPPPFCSKSRAWHRLPPAFLSALLRFPRCRPAVVQISLPVGDYGGFCSEG